MRLISYGLMSVTRPILLSAATESTAVFSVPRILCRNASIVQDLGDRLNLTFCLVRTLPQATPYIFHAYRLEIRNSLAFCGYCRVHTRFGDHEGEDVRC
ncbi:hypothetical protein BDR05DRAFT_969406 [Suillus weaverae]|nr:hypothetical protein BDR05DRAFT_969406 [Suillus weaverae]